MSGETEAAGALRSALAGVMPPALDAGALAEAMRVAVETATEACSILEQARGANSLDHALRMGVAAVLALEAHAVALRGLSQYTSALYTAAQASERTARASVGGALLEMGCPAVDTPWHIATPIEPQPHVEVDDPAALPLQYWRSRDPEPDRRALLSALKRGPVPGAHLARGVASLRIAVKPGIAP